MLKIFLLSTNYFFVQPKITKIFKRAICCAESECRIVQKNIESKYYYLEGMVPDPQSCAPWVYIFGPQYFKFVFVKVCRKSSFLPPVLKDFFRGILIEVCFYFIHKINCYNYLYLQVNSLLLFTSHNTIAYIQCLCYGKIQFRCSRFGTQKIDTT